MSNFGDKIKTIGFVRSSTRTRPSATSGMDSSGRRYLAVTDELGNTVTEWDDHQDVTIQASPITVTTITRD